MNRVNAYPMRKSSSIRVATALTCFSSKSISRFAAERTCLSAVRLWFHVFRLISTYARSTLLNLARLTRIELLPFLAASTISWPICSPSRSQSVHITSRRAYLAWSDIFCAMAFLSCETVSQMPKTGLQRSIHRRHS